MTQNDRKKLQLTSYVPKIKNGIVVKVYDGDTITVCSKVPYLLNSKSYTFPIRLARIDCPELKSKNEEEKTCAQQVQQILEDILLDNRVKLQVSCADKYGRLLCEVYFKNININDWMLENHYAVEYHGGTKKSPDSWEGYMSSANRKPFIHRRTCFSYFTSL